MAGFKQFSADDTLTAADINNRTASHEMVNSQVLGNGVVEGLNLSYSGLDLTISAGKLLAKVGVSLPSITITVPPSVSRYVWLDSDGAYVLSASADSPGSAYACVGYFVSGASAITSVSTDGRQLPALLFTDDRVASILGGMKLDGETGTISIQKIKGNGVPVQSGYANIGGSKTDADYTLLATEYECQRIRLGWTGWTGAHNVIVPAVVADWTIINDTGQTATVKASSGTGIAIANGKAATVFFDGANVRRLTLDA